MAHRNNGYRHGEPLLAAVIASRWSGQRLQQLGELQIATRLSDWRDALQVHGLAGILATRHAEALTELPPAYGECVQALHREQGPIALRQFFEIQQMLGAFAAAGLRAIPFKGVVLSEQLYGGIAVRSSRDIDILIDPADLDAAMDLLPTLDYLPIPELRANRTLAHWTAAEFKDLEYFRPGHTPLELHVRTERAVEAALPPLRSLSSLSDFSCQSLRCSVLPAELTALAVARHALRSPFRWKWLYDTVESLRWQTGARDPFTLLHEGGLDRSQRLCLLLAAREWGLPTPRPPRSETGTVWLLSATASSWRASRRRYRHWSWLGHLLRYRGLQLPAECAGGADWRARMRMLRRRCTAWHPKHGLWRARVVRVAALTAPLFHLSRAGQGLLGGLLRVLLPAPTATGQPQSLSGSADGG